jgi:hypothetical protein
VPTPEWIFTLQPPQRVNPANVYVRLPFFSRMNHPRRFLALEAVFLTTTHSAFICAFWPPGTTPGNQGPSAGLSTASLSRP